MTMATSPCPPWCRINHDRYRNHAQTVHDANGIRVLAFQYDGDQDRNVSVVTGPAGQESVVEIQPSQAPAFARLIETIGHPELGAAIRETAAFMAVAQGGDVAW